MASTIAKIQPDSGRSGTLFCIDAGPYMFEVNEDDEEKRTHMLIALKAIRTEMNMICCSADLRQMVGIIFFNTAKTNIEAEALDNIFVYRKLVELKENGFMKGIDADAVKQVDELINDERKRKEFFEQTLGSSGECDYSQLVWLLQRTFRYALNSQKKTAFVFSRNQFMSDYNEALLAKVKIGLDDAKAAGIQITHMLLGEDDVAEHWDSLEVEAEVFDSAEKLISGIKRKNVSRRPTATIPLHFGHDMSLAVSVFHLIAPQNLETGVYLNEKTNTLVQCKTRHVKQPSLNDKMSLASIIGEDESGEAPKERETVDAKKIKLTRRIGGTEININKEEFEKFKRIDDPGVYIIGFKPMTYLKTSHQIGPCHYLFPNEDLVNGSACLYRALLQSCIEKNVFILARYVLKRNTMPKLVALIPQRKGDPESKETDAEDLFYEGFHLVPPPFAEDKRNLQSKLEGDWPIPTDDQVKAAESFVNKLTTKYSPEMYSNPVLQKHYWVLEGLATDNDELGENFEFDQIKPYFEKTTRGKEEVTEFEKKLR
jgi:ATP-dependent DNA helicase 2 subunit 1